eukprot:scaffold41136_cov172-Skeletonema_dohrnii-CCMP3373.AAC.2
MEEEISRKFREALLRELPADQHPLNDEFGLNNAEEKEMLRLMQMRGPAIWQELSMMQSSYVMQGAVLKLPLAQLK